MAGDVAELATHLGFGQFRVAGEDWGAAIAYAIAAFHRPRVQQLAFQETLLPGLPAGPGLPGGEHDPSLAADDVRTGWHFSFFSLPNVPELLLAGRERPFWTWYARRQMWDPSALAEDIDEIVHSAEQPGGTRAILEMYRARQTDAEQNRPHYADPISCPVLAVGAQAYLGDKYPDSSRTWPATSAAPSSPRPVTTSRWRTRPPWPRPTSTSSQAAKPRIQPRDPAAYRSSISDRSKSGRAYRPSGGGPAWQSRGRVWRRVWAPS
jgi:pimeloyl-ACP methyl ester carboxylesterase